MKLIMTVLIMGLVVYGSIANAQDAFHKTTGQKFFVEDLDFREAMITKHFAEVKSRKISQAKFIDIMNELDHIICVDAQIMQLELGFVSGEGRREGDPIYTFDNVDSQPAIKILIHIHDGLHGEFLRYY